MTDVFESTDSLEEFKALMQDPAARQAFVELKATKAEQDTRARYSHILKVVGETPWAIRRSMLAVIVDVLAYRAQGGRLTSEEISDRIGAQRPGPSQPAGVAVLPLYGVIVPKASLFSEVSGATSVQGFRQMFREAMAAREVSAIVIDVDSPGGMTDQVPELAAEIRAARGKKPIVAVANTEMASAAYWLASQADEIVVSKSSLVGSIGVYTVHEDHSGAEEQAGIKTTLISAGKHKTDGNPWEPLNEDGKATLQRLVDEFYGMFVTDVARGRGVSVDVVRNGYGEGRILGSKDAVAQGLAERVGTLEEVIAGLLPAPQQRQTAAYVSRLPEPTPDPEPEPVAEGIKATMMTKPQSEVTFHTVANGDGTRSLEMRSAVDNSEWDGNRAMSECESAADYRKICAGEREVAETDQRQHWALPHHYLARHPDPNAAGVRNALARLPQTEGLVNREAALAHLEAHMREINPEREEARDDLGDQIAFLRVKPAPRDPLSK